MSIRIKFVISIEMFVNEQTLGDLLMSVTRYTEWHSVPDREDLATSFSVYPPNFQSTATILFISFHRELISSLSLITKNNY